MLSLMLLACKSEQDLQTSNQNPGVTQTCECTEEAETLSTLREELDVLSDRVIELEAIVTEGTTEPSVVVTEYEVDCANQTVRLDWYDYYEMASPLTYTDTGEYTRDTHPWVCVIGKVDPADPPWSMTSSYVEDLSLSMFRYSEALSVELIGRDYPEAFDLLSNFGNQWVYRYPGSTNGFGYSESRIHSDGWVVSGVPWQADCTSYSSSDGDCPLRADLAKLRVVIIDDKPALRPEAW